MKRTEGKNCLSLKEGKRGSDLGCSQQEKKWYCESKCDFDLVQNRVIYCERDSHLKGKWHI